MNRLSQSLVSNTTPSFLLEWLTQELNNRDIDTVYTRYILSLLQQDYVDPCECQHTKQCYLNAKRRYGMPKNSSTKHKNETLKILVQQIPTSTISCCSRKRSDIEKLKKEAAVECLKSAYDDVDDIEELINEVIFRLRSLQNQRGNKDNFRNINAVGADKTFYRPPSSSLLDIQKYFDDFPCLDSPIEENTEVRDRSITIWDLKNFNTECITTNKVVQFSDSLCTVQRKHQPVIPYSSLKPIKNVFKTQSLLLLTNNEVNIECTEIEINNFILGLKHSQNVKALEQLVYKYVLLVLTHTDVKPKLEFPLWQLLSEFNNTNISGISLSFKRVKYIKCLILLTFEEYSNDVIYFNNSYENFICFTLPSVGKSIIYLFKFLDADVDESIKNFKDADEFTNNFKTAVRCCGKNLQNFIWPSVDLLHQVKISKSKECLILQYFENIKDCMQLGNILKSYAIDGEIETKVSSKHIFEIYVKALFLYFDRHSKNIFPGKNALCCISYANQLFHNDKIKEFLHDSAKVVNPAKEYSKNTHKKTAFTFKSINYIDQKNSEQFSLFSNVNISSIISQSKAKTDINQKQNINAIENIVHSLGNALNDPSFNFNLPYIKSVWASGTNLSKKNNSKISDKKWLLFWEENQSAIEHIWSNDFTSHESEQKSDVDYSSTIVINNIENNSEIEYSSENCKFVPDFEHCIQTAYESNTHFDKCVLSDEEEINNQNSFILDRNDEHCIVNFNSFDESNNSLDNNSDQIYFDSSILSSYDYYSVCETEQDVTNEWNNISMEYVSPTGDDPTSCEMSFIENNDPDLYSPYYFNNSCNLEAVELEPTYSDEVHFEKQQCVSETKKTKLNKSRTDLLSNNVKKKLNQNQPACKRPCYFYLQGSCQRNDCKYSHDMSTVTCRFWKEGECFKGLTCPFLHGFVSDDSFCDEDLTSCNSYSLESEEDFPSLSLVDTETTKVTTSPMNVIQEKCSQKKKKKKSNTAIAISPKDDK